MLTPPRLLQYEQATGIALARANVDFSGFQTANAEAEERRLMPRYVEQHFVNAAREIGLKVEPRADGLYRVEHVLADLRSERLAAVRRLGKPETTYRKVTFHKEHLEMDQHIDAVLIGPGHPLYAAVDERLNEMLATLTDGCRRVRGHEQRRSLQTALLRDGCKRPEHEGRSANASG